MYWKMSELRYVTSNGLHIDNDVKVIEMPLALTDSRTPCLFGYAMYISDL